MGCLIALVLALISMYLSASQLDVDSHVDLHSVGVKGSWNDGRTSLRGYVDRNFGSHDTNAGVSLGWKFGRPVLNMRRQWKGRVNADSNSVGLEGSRREKVGGSVSHNHRNHNTDGWVNAQHTSKDDRSSVGGYVNHNSGNTRGGVNIGWKFGRPVLNMRRQWKGRVHGDLSSITVEGSGTFNDGHTTVEGSVTHNRQNHNTNGRVSAQHTFENGVSVGASVNRYSGNTGGGLNVIIPFGRPVLNMRRQLDLERFVNPVSVGVRDNHSWNARLLPKRQLDVEEVADFDDPPNRWLDSNRWLDYEPARLWIVSQ